MKCWTMIQILPNVNTNSVFINSIFKFVREYDTSHENPEEFKSHCRLLENARQGYLYDELGDAESGIIYVDGNATTVYVCQILEEVCLYIETYRAETLFGTWRYTNTDRVAPEFPAEKKSMHNLIFSLNDHLRPMRQSAGRVAVRDAITHLEQNFEYIVSELNRLRAVEQSGSVHDQHLAQLKLLGSCSR